MLKILKKLNLIMINIKSFIKNLSIDRSIFLNSLLRPWCTYYCMEFFNSYYCIGIINI
jgi:hypothetical protein